MKRVGTKSEVYFGHAKKTAKGVTKDELTLSPKGYIVLKSSIKRVEGGSGLGALFGMFNHKFPSTHPDMSMHRPPPSWYTNPV